MPDLVEQMYCSQQIMIPTNLPSILKKYAKAAIRTQPLDLLVWSSAYFKALANDYPPPVKERLEFPPPNSPSGLSPGFLKVLINQMGKVETVPRDVITDRWKGVCLDQRALTDIMEVGMFDEDVPWFRFIAICAGIIEPSLTRTMILLCELLTNDPEGGDSMIPVETFLELYSFLAKLDCGSINPRPPKPETPPPSEDPCDEIRAGEELEENASDISWDEAIENLSKATSERSSETNPIDSEKEIMAWPPDQTKPDAGEPNTETRESLRDAGGSSDYGLQVFTNVNPEQYTVAKPVSEVVATTDERGGGGGGVDDKEESIFAPKFENLADVLDDDLGPKRDSGKLLLDTIQSRTDTIQVDPNPSEISEPISKKEFFIEDNEGPMEESAVPEEYDFTVLVEPDESMMNIPTPVGSETFLYADPDLAEAKDKTDPNRLLVHTQSLIDVRIKTPKMKEMTEEVITMLREPKWIYYPGIGGVVPDPMISAVETYFNSIAKQQSGMVMPRNLRHFICPPLEVYTDSEESKIK